MARNRHSGTSRNGNIVGYKRDPDMDKKPVVVRSEPKEVKKRGPLVLDNIAGATAREVINSAGRYFKQQKCEFTLGELLVTTEALSTVFGTKYLGIHSYASDAEVPVGSLVVYLGIKLLPEMMSGELIKVPRHTFIVNGSRRVIISLNALKRV